MAIWAGTGEGDYFSGGAMAVRAGTAEGDYFGRGAMAVLVKNAQMTDAAPGVLPLGGGKLWPPESYTANPMRVPDVQWLHMVNVMAGYGVTADCRVHLSAVRRRLTSTVAAATCRIDCGRLTTQPGCGAAFTIAVASNRH